MLRSVTGGGWDPWVAFVVGVGKIALGTACENRGKSIFQEVELVGVADGLFASTTCEAGHHRYFVSCLFIDFDVDGSV